LDRIKHPPVAKSMPKRHTVCQSTLDANEGHLRASIVLAETLLMNREETAPSAAEPRGPSDITMKMHAVDDINSRGGKFYRHALQTLLDAGLPFLVGGAYALETHTGIVRRTKDFDIFVRPVDAERTLRLLSEAGYHTEMPFP